jgi:ankyrin repeat protein
MNLRTIELSVACLTAWLLLIAPTCGGEASALADAVEKKDAAAIETLLGKKVDVQAAQADGMTALHWAVQHDDLGLVKRLIAAAADVKTANRFGVTPLAVACTNGNGEIVEQLLAAGADANGALPGGETALMTAARTGRLSAVKALLARGADVNAREHKSQTALMWSAAEGNVEVVDALLAAGADFRATLPSGFSALFFAVREGRHDVVFQLLKAGMNVDEVMQPERKGANRKASNSLLLAVENGHFELAVALLNAGADPNARPGGYSALHALTWVRKPIRGDGDPPPIGSGNMNSLEMVRQLAKHGADVNSRLERGESGRGRFTTTGSTPFELAARASDVPLLRLFHEIGADPKIANIDDCPPLLAAAGVGALSDGDDSAGTDDEALATVRYLLEIGADVNAVDKNGETVMHGAAYLSRWQLVQLLSDSGAKIEVWNQKNKLGWTPLMIAQGHRPGNFRPDSATIAAFERVMRSHGVEPPKATRNANSPEY